MQEQDTAPTGSKEPGQVAAEAYGLSWPNTSFQSRKEWRSVEAAVLRAYGSREEDQRRIAELQSDNEENQDRIRELVNKLDERNQRIAQLEDKLQKQEPADNGTFYTLAEFGWNEDSRIAARVRELLAELPGLKWAHKSASNGPIDRRKDHIGWLKEELEASCE